MFALCWKCIIYLWLIFCCIYKFKAETEFKSNWPLNNNFIFTMIEENYSYISMSFCPSWKFVCAFSEIVSMLTVKGNCEFYYVILWIENCIVQDNFYQQQKFLFFLQPVKKKKKLKSKKERDKTRLKGDDSKKPAAVPERPSSVGSYWAYVCLT